MPAPQLYAGLDFSPQAVLRVLRHPGFPATMRAVARLHVEQYRGNWVLNRIASDRGRLIAALMVADLHFNGNGGAGFTLAELREQAALHGFASPRRLVAWAASLQLFGFLQRIGRTRPQRLVPTELFLNGMRERTRRTWTALAPLHPGSLRAGEKLARQDAMAIAAGSFMAPYRAGFRLLQLTPEFASLGERDAGLMILLNMVAAEEPGQAHSISEMARQFTVSRAHVGALMQEAELSGMVVRVERGRYAPGPLLQDALGRFFAALFIGNMHAIDRVLAGCAD